MDILTVTVRDGPITHGVSHWAGIHLSADLIILLLDIIHSSDSALVYTFPTVHTLHGITGVVITAHG